ncbi:MAG TPA: GNAT family N-acetyltransferase, partial [Candidatus Limnocylindria bacterium]|nr:GNAT family N-acetyltransferase [Candidatus Limnocylindria bacterium]
MPDGQHPPRPPVPILHGELVYLRPAERSDLELFVRWLSDAEVGRHLAVRSPISQAMEDKWFDQVVEQQGRDRYHFTICLLADGRPIGATDLREINLEDGRAAFGILIGEKDEWGKG